MKTLEVRVPGGAYPILIGCGILDRIPRWFRRRGLPSSLELVSDRRVFQLHGRRVEEALGVLGVPVRKVIVPAGEGSKSSRQLERLWRKFCRDRIDRRAWIVALGGGVVGDLAGFAAASVLRGVGLIQIPTSLLAMVDSSVGGKTGINLPEGKNLVGAFHQPGAVFIDVDFLATLPRRELRAGWAEVIKAAAIRDARLFRVLERHARELSTGRSRLLESVIRTACRIKAEVVSADEKEAGLRMILNFGHTLGHGVEAAGGYRGLLHGEAVAVGMAFAARFGRALGLTSGDADRRIQSLLKAFRLPVKLTRNAVRTPRVLDAMLRDKKKGPAGPRWVLVSRVGRVGIHEDIPWEAAKVAVKNFLEEP